MKAYKLLDMEINRVFVSRDVVFHETIFPFLNTSTSSTDVSHLFYDKVLLLPSNDFEESTLVETD